MCNTRLEYWRRYTHGAVLCAARRRSPAIRQPYCTGKEPMFSSTRSSFDTVFSAMRTSWRGSSRRHRRTPIRRRLRFERLEGRTMLSEVTTQAALIAAINAANAAGGSNSITLGADITLYETTANNTHDGPNGLPSITSGDNLTIVGKGHVIQRSTSSGDAAFRLFDVASGASLNLNNMSLENGRVSGSTATTLQGGAIFVDSRRQAQPRPGHPLRQLRQQRRERLPKHIGRRRDLQRGDRDDCRQHRDGQLRRVQSHQRCRPGRRPGRQRRLRPRQQRQWQRSYW